VAPVWDGNETWLVLGGGGLLAAFPLAYAIILPALYAPLIAMLLGLVFRGVAFEYRWRDPGHRKYWDFAFFSGSLVATFMQGVTLGALLYGIHVEGRSYAGGWWDWLSLYSLMTGAGLVAGYALLGACWLIWKTEGALHVRVRRHATLLVPALLAAIGAVSLYTPFVLPQYFERWFQYPGLFVTVPMPLLFGGVALALWWSIGRGRDWMPFAFALGLFLLSMAGLAISIWPDVIPGRVTIWQAAAPYSSQIFMLVGALVLVPVILIYTGWAYWVFGGKVGEHGYH
jgi:cytochrome d ubiquinol oxidase subunit II